eukprot:4173769-Prymnesium_polylepis.1
MPRRRRSRHGGRPPCSARARTRPTACRSRPNGTRRGGRDATRTARLRPTQRMPANQTGSGRERALGSGKRLQGSGGALRRPWEGGNGCKKRAVGA